MIEMRVLDYRITSDDRQVIVNKARRNEHGELTILTDKDGTQKESLALIGYYGNLRVKQYKQSKNTKKS
ncbi:MAG: hypothetical protein E6X75_04325 [Enterococcus faecalis]|nr:hypothetical protein [Enterococcus faecalis]